MTWLRITRISLLALWLGSGVGWSIETFTVTCVDGTKLEIDGAENEDDWIYLHLAGTESWMTLPAGQIENWQELERWIEGPDIPDVDAQWRKEAGPHAAAIARSAQTHRLPPELLAAVARVESAFKPAAVSHKGATGLLQLMPATAKRFGVKNILDPDQNIEGGARYLSWLLDHFDGRLDLALAGYNAGENAVARYDGVPPYRETRFYVVKVMKIAARYGLVMTDVE